MHDAFYQFIASANGLAFVSEVKFEGLLPVVDRQAQGCEGWPSAFERGKSERTGDARAVIRS